MRIAIWLKVRLVTIAVIAPVLAMIWTKPVTAGQDYRFAEEPQSMSSSDRRPAATDDLFQTKAVAIPTNRFRGKWENLAASMAGAASPLDACDDVKAPCSQAAIRWVSYLSAIRSLPKGEQIGLVNRYVNEHIKYTSDNQATGVRDLWINPFQATGGRGDCEDYAIAKYVSLIFLGFSDEQLRLVIVRDLNMGEMHALTTVSVDETIYVLDNRFESVLPHRDVTIYQPIYSFNQRQSWVHVVRSVGYRPVMDDPAS